MGGGDYTVQEARREYFDWNDQSKSSSQELADSTDTADSSVQRD